jgi:hypothetical protein
MLEAQETIVKSVNPWLMPVRYLHGVLVRHLYGKNLKMARFFGKNYDNFTPRQIPFLIRSKDKRVRHILYLGLSFHNRLSRFFLNVERIFIRRGD